MKLCLGTRAIPLAPQTMTATEAMEIAGTRFFGHRDQRRRPLCSPVSPPTEPAESHEFPGTVPFHSTVPLLGLRGRASSQATGPGRIPLSAFG
ncbi:MAG TPA: hypothetical protein VL485_11135 [Ktedonobacteraceae bacterium]|nr:hypothetical protein [Ktedonobacteraceae bacterium]